MKVYFVYFGESPIYSPIIRVFDSREKAKLFVKNRKNWDSNKLVILEEEVD